MKERTLAQRYGIFVFGMLLISFGVTLVTKASLGTSPITAIPYSLSLILPRLSLGNWTIVFYALLIVVQFFMLRGKAKPLNLLLQLVVSFFFGYLIDGTMFLLGWFQPTLYITKLAALLLGCFILASGVYAQIVANVVMLPGDAFVKTLSEVTRREYGGIRVMSDVSMSLIAAALCLIFLRELVGVREGTVIASLLIGNIVKLITKFFNSRAETKSVTLDAEA